MELLNCLPTERTLFLRTEDGLVEVPRGPRVFVSDSRDPDARAVELTTPSGTAVLEVGAAKPSWVFLLPEPREGVLLLVEAETVMRLPFRDDLVAPAHFGHPSKEEREGRDRRPSILTGVHSRFDLASPDVDVFTEEALREAALDHEPAVERDAGADDERTSRSED
jgi:hypothetical protein